MSKFKFFLLINILVFGLLITHYHLPITNAQSARSYDYSKFDVQYIINSDSTVDVTETQTFNFTGQYNLGWRNIPTRIGEWITDVKVIDATLLAPLQYSPTRLTKTTPSSWGKFTTYNDDGTNIEWYYNLADTTHTFQIQYKLHGAIEFGTQYDRFYWNAFTDFQIPIHSSIVTVKLPANIPTADFQQFSYRNAPDEIEQQYTEGRASFMAEEFSPYEPFTVDIAWPKGLISKSDYWKSLLLANFGFVAIPFILIATFVFCLVFWLRHEYYPAKARPIIPIYEPPSDLSPALAGVLVNESFSPKTFAATIVDLAVRGYLKIEEIPATKLQIFGIWFLRIFFGLVFGVPSVVFLFAAIATGFAAPALVLFFVFGSLALSMLWVVIKPPKNYKVSQTSKYFKAHLSDYERTFVDTLSDDQTYFQTDKLSSASRSRKMEVFQIIQQLQKDILKDAQTKTDAYLVPPAREQYKWLIWIFLIIAIVGGPFWMSLFLSGQTLQILILTLELIANGLFLLTFIKMEARLSHTGNELKNKWLGFKLYLSVAEKERLKNLTPEMFEKFLPYAMVFGVEKQWSKAFDGLLKEPPTWYHGTYIGSFGHGSSSGSFSASSFGASFSASFSSSIASSGATGSSGGGGAGGGGAGGGGGGGGGGAG